MFCVFFFKQKTAYEMRISDWSSDVCSSDLAADGGVVSKRRRLAVSLEHCVLQCVGGVLGVAAGDPGEPVQLAVMAVEQLLEGVPRSEERRVGKSVSVRVDLGGSRTIKKKKHKQ